MSDLKCCSEHHRYLGGELVTPARCDICRVAAGKPAPEHEDADRQLRILRAVTWSLALVAVAFFLLAVMAI